MSETKTKFKGTNPNKRFQEIQLLSDHKYSVGDLALTTNGLATFRDGSGWVSGSMVASSDDTEELKNGINKLKIVINSLIMNQQQLIIKANEQTTFLQSVNTHLTTSSVNNSVVGEEMIAYNGQNLFTFYDMANFSPSDTAVYVNGSLVPTKNYTAYSNCITFNQPLNQDDVVRVIGGMEYGIVPSLPHLTDSTLYSNMELLTLDEVKEEEVEIVGGGPMLSYDQHTKDVIKELALCEIIDEEIMNDIIKNGLVAEEKEESILIYDGQDEIQNQNQNSITDNLFTIELVKEPICEKAIISESLNPYNAYDKAMRMI